MAAGKIFIYGLKSLGHIVLSYCMVLSACCSYVQEDRKECCTTREDVWLSNGRSAHRLELGDGIPLGMMSSELEDCSTRDQNENKNARMRRRGNRLWGELDGWKGKPTGGRIRIPVTWSRRVSSPSMAPSSIVFPCKSYSVTVMTHVSSGCHEYSWSNQFFFSQVWKLCIDA